jgi:3-phosphoshikimate 1-carboxyvinyltransferase
MDMITIKAGKQILGGTVHLPLSKSISNRLLIINALSEGRTKYTGLSDADDTVLMADLLQQIAGAETHDIFARNAGTVFRFLTSYLAITPGNWTLYGNERMRQRPVGPLVEALIALGADIQYSAGQGYAPLFIHGKPLKGGMVEIDISDSSQFASSIMMIAPLLANGLQLHLTGSGSALSYVRMTTGIMQQAGIEIVSNLPSVSINRGMYKDQVLQNERDWSSAAFWYELIALSQGGEVFLPGLKRESLQGDSRVAAYFGQLGVETDYTDEGVMIKKSGQVLKSIDIDLKDCPDLAPALVVSAAALGINANFTGLKNLSLKESDRIEALSTELKRMGIRSAVSTNSISFGKQTIKIKEPVETHRDHRIAMAFAPLAILGNPVSLNKPEVVSKSYPGYWKALKKMLAAD